jgi:hypothetical protein
MLLSYDRVPSFGFRMRVGVHLRVELTAYSYERIDANHYYFLSRHVLDSWKGIPDAHQPRSFMKAPHVALSWKD